MIELLGLIFGGGFRLLPEIIKFFTAGKDRDHEFRMTSLQLEIDKARSALRIDEVHAQGNAAEQAAWAQALQDAISAQGKPSGVPWVDALSSSVRPVLTYWHCLVLYTSQKVAVALIASEAGATWASIVSQSYTTFDQQLVGSMVGFWFVDRSLRKS